MADKGSSVKDTHRFHCEVCGKAFRRQEHLSRHRISHTDEKPYKCSRCGKCFARIDTLDRHALLHKQNSEPVGRRNFARACQPCATSRIRCSRGLPCTQCDKKGRVCTYPKSSRSVNTRSHIEGTLATDSGGRSEAEDLPTTDHISLAVPQSPAPGPGVSVQDDHLDAPYIPPVNEKAPAAVDAHRLEHLTQSVPDKPPQNSIEPYQRDTQESLVATNIVSGVNWWSSELQDTENWILDQALVSNWYFPTFGLPADVAQVPYDLPRALTVQSHLEPAGATPSGWSHQGHQEGEHSSEEVATTRSPFAETFRNMVDSLEPETTHPIGAPGKYYVEGSAGRAAFGGNSNTTPSTAPQDGSCSGMTPVRRSAEAAIADTAANTPFTDDRERSLSDTVYVNLINNLRAALSQHSLERGQERFPSSSELGLFVRCYFDRFHCVFPFLRRSDFQGEEPPWIVVLAVAAVGAHLSKSQCGTYLHSLLATVLQNIFFGVTWSDQIQAFGISLVECNLSSNDLSVVQSAILNLILMVQSGSAALVSSALVERAHLVERCETMGLLDSCGKRKTRPNKEVDDSRIKDWLHSQASLRAGLMIWLLDTILAYQTNCTFRLSSLSPAISLPSSERVWENPSLVNVSQEEADQLPMLDALETIWISKRLPPNLTHFSYILLVHAIYRRVQDVALQSQTQLSTWIPNSSSQVTNSVFRSFGRCPPTDEMYNKWRNSACDSLDILHWSMNAQIAGHGGWEHPCVSYLHLSRLLLLSPVAHLQTLAADPLALRPTFGEQRNDIQDMLSSARSCVIRWAVQDRFKARLCLVHAGALYWHIRRYGVGSIVEPFGIYLATLVLWAYSVVLQVSAGMNPDRSQSELGRGCQGNDEQQCQLNQISNPEELDLRPKMNTPFLYLDRPCDDEMVQNFVREGHIMTAYVYGVGSVSMPGASKKILREGKRLLESINGQSPSHNTSSGLPESSSYTWGVQKRYMESLARLEAISE